MLKRSMRTWRTKTRISISRTVWRLKQAETTMTTSRRLKTKTSRASQNLAVRRAARMRTGRAREVTATRTQRRRRARRRPRRRSPRQRSRRRRMRPSPRSKRKIPTHPRGRNLLGSCSAMRSETRWSRRTPTSSSPRSTGRSLRYGRTCLRRRRNRTRKRQPNWHPGTRRTRPSTTKRTLAAAVRSARAARRKRGRRRRPRRILTRPREDRTRTCCGPKKLVTR
mmetsp:Transcript_13645/g.31415  ORF Transcript_13645/g.31415 Transcript_13645/m.31415 type:complete len:224 (-) Transcript_13645:1095-1766(-)